ncbi:hypothetical protein WMZ97_06380 [Lentibacillus sp. N15]
MKQEPSSGFLLFRLGFNASRVVGCLKREQDGTSTGQSTHQPNLVNHRPNRAHINRI